MIISLDLMVQFTQEGASSKTTSSNAHLTWRPPVTKKLIFFQKVGPENALAGRVNVDEIFLNFIFMF